MELFASYTGTGFLVFYLGLLAACVFAGLWIAAFLRPAGRPGEVTHAEEAAVLAGGTDRHAMTVAADLVAREGLAPASRRKFQVERSDVAASSAGRSVLREGGDLGLRELQRVTARDAEAIEDELVRRGLLMDSGERLRLRWLSIAPYAALLALGLYRYAAGNAAGEPTGFLLGLLLVTVLLAAIRFGRFNRRTSAGNEVVRELEQRSSRLKRAPVANEVGFAVAVFGTGVLVGTPWEPVHAMRQGAAGGSDGGGSGDDGGDGGGCGGGCGGCGG